MRFKNDLVFFVDVKRNRKEELKFRLNPSKTPREIDMVGVRPDEPAPTGKDGKTEQPAREFVLVGIYELKGDRLKLCWSRIAVRPKNVDGGGNLEVMILKRDKK